MAVTYLTGFEAQEVAADNIALTGTAAYSTAQHRTGAASIRCNPASGANGAIECLNALSGYVHFGLYVATLPTVSRMICCNGTDGLWLQSDGKIDARDNGTSVGTSTTALTTGAWYWIGVRDTGGTSVVLLQIEGANQVTATATWPGLFARQIGLGGGEASAIDLYFDDIIVDDAGFLAPSKVGLLLPISDNARAALWTGGVGGTTNLFDAVNNTPPIGTAAETDLTQIEHAGNSGGTTDAYDANMTTYSTAGIAAADTVLAVQSRVAWGEDVATGTKLLSYSIVSNPTAAGESSIDVSTGQGSGAVGTYPSFWNVRSSAITASPSVTLGTSPVMRVLRPETALRVASVCFMGISVAWTPAAGAARPIPLRIISQAVQRAATW